MKIYLQEKSGGWKLYEGDLKKELDSRHITISKSATIGDGATIGEWATICKGATISERATIGEGATIYKGATIAARATIGNGVKISTSYDCIVLGPLGSRKAMLTGYMNNGDLIISTGCFMGGINEFEAAVKKQHTGTRHEEEYLAAVDYLRRKFQFQSK